MNIALFGFAAWWLVDTLRTGGRWVMLLATALVHEAGMIGWKAGISVHDLEGITSPDVLRMCREGSGFGVVSVAKEMAPDFIVISADRCRRARGRRCVA